MYLGRRHVFAALAVAAVSTTRAAPSGGLNAITERVSLVGSWTVDLRPTPEAAPYLKKLVITAVVGTRIEGHFYDGSPLQAGRVNRVASPMPCLAFFTDPGEGVYQTSARQIDDDRLEGMTLSTTRGFLLPWTAVRDRSSADAVR